jgi:Zn-dependent peptidase ImmA (M78 family)
MNFYNETQISAERKSYIILSAADLIKQLNINRLPIKMRTVYTSLNCGLISTNKISQKYNNDDFLKIKSNKIDATTIYHHKYDNYITIYDENIRYERRKFTFAHELGHIILNHFKDYNDVLQARNMSDELYRILEKEADFFAAEFLAPLNVLKLLNSNSIEEIINISSISKKAAAMHLNELKNYKENPIYIKLAPFYTKQFNDYIIEINKKRSDLQKRYRIMQHITPIPKTIIEKYCFCGNTDFKDNEWICNKCGHKLITKSKDIVEFEYDKDKITEDEFNYIMEYLESNKIERSS